MPVKPKEFKPRHSGDGASLLGKLLKSLVELRQRSHRLADGFARGSFSSCGLVARLEPLMAAPKHSIFDVFSRACGACLAPWPRASHGRAAGLGPIASEYRGTSSFCAQADLSNRPERDIATPAPKISSSEVRLPSLHTTVVCERLAAQLLVPRTRLRLFTSRLLEDAYGLR